MWRVGPFWEHRHKEGATEGGGGLNCEGVLLDVGKVWKVVGPV